MSEQPAAYGGERPEFMFTDSATKRQLAALGVAVVDQAAIDAKDARIATLEAALKERDEALLRTWYDADSDICTVCEHTQHMETSSSGHAPDCIIPSIERQALAQRPE